MVNERYVTRLLQEADRADREFHRAERAEAERNALLAAVRKAIDELLVGLPDRAQATLLRALAED